MANPRQEDKSSQEAEDTVRRAGEGTAQQSERIGRTMAEQTARM